MFLYPFSHSFSCIFVGLFFTCSLSFVFGFYFQTHPSSGTPAPLSRLWKGSHAKVICLFSLFPRYPVLLGRIYLLWISHCRVWQAPDNNHSETFFFSYKNIFDLGPSFKWLPGNWLIHPMKSVRWKERAHHCSEIWKPWDKAWSDLSPLRSVPS